MYPPRAKKVDPRALQKLIILCLMKIAVGRFLCNRLDLFLWGLLHKKNSIGKLFGRFLDSGNSVLEYQDRPFGGLDADLIRVVSIQGAGNWLAT